MCCRDCWSYIALCRKRGMAAHRGKTHSTQSHPASTPRRFNRLLGVLLLHTLNNHYILVLILKTDAQTTGLHVDNLLSNPPGLLIGCVGTLCTAAILVSNLLHCRIQIYTLLEGVRACEYS